jgi:hypothetical protein
LDGVDSELEVWVGEGCAGLKVAAVQPVTGAKSSPLPLSHPTLRPSRRPHHSLSHTQSPARIQPQTKGHRRHQPRRHPGSRPAALRPPGPQDRVPAPDGGRARQDHPHPQVGGAGLLFACRYFEGGSLADGRRSAVCFSAQISPHPPTSHPVNPRPPPPHPPYTLCSRKMNVGPDVNFEELARSTDDFNAAQVGRAGCRVEGCRV